MAHDVLAPRNRARILQYARRREAEIHEKLSFLTVIDRRLLLKARRLACEWAKSEEILSSEKPARLSLCINIICNF